MTNNLYAHRGFMLPSARWAHGILCTSVYYTLGKASEKRFLRLCPAQRTSLTHPYTYCKFCPIAFLEIGLDFSYLDRRDAFWIILSNKWFDCLNPSWFEGDNRTTHFRKRKLAHVLFVLFSWLSLKYERKLPLCNWWRCCQKCETKDMTLGQESNL